MRANYISLQKSIYYFDNCICHQNCRLEIVPKACGRQLWQYNTRGVQEQLTLLQELGSLLRHQISVIHNKGHYSLTKILVMRTAVLYLSVTCYNHNELLPCLQTNWRDSGYIWKFSLGLETNLAGITTIVLWGSHLLPSGHENFHDDAVSDLVDVPRIVSEEIWTQLPGMCLLQSVFCKVNSCCTPIASIAHRWLSQGTNLASSLKIMSQLQLWW